MITNIYCVQIKIMGHPSLLDVVRNIGTNCGKLMNTVQVLIKILHRLFRDVTDFTRAGHETITQALVVAGMLLVLLLVAVPDVLHDVKFPLKIVSAQCARKLGTNVSPNVHFQIPENTSFEST